MGVDVFFVISGYLITGLLQRELTKNGSISLPRFYSRRVRRLAPVATLVLLATLAATPLLPEALWSSTAWEVVASAMYVENWRLSWLAIDYLGAGETPSPVQHYWSLSIEEQFYILWPGIMIAGTALARRMSLPPRLGLLLILWALTVTSFVASVALTRRSPESAYFLTHTRAWELGLGGLLALHSLPPLAGRIRELMRSLGLGAIIISAVTYSEETAFPGYAAVLPTLGTALVIAAGATQARWSSFRLLACRPSQQLGDISYSLYLWHWPIIVVYGAYHPGHIDLSNGLAIAVICLLLSTFSKRHIEDRFRLGSKDTPRPWSALGVGLGSISLTSGAAALVLFVVEVPQPLAARGLPKGAYPGPYALLTNAPVPPGVSVRPSLAVAKKDTADVYENGCHLRFSGIDPRPCEYGRGDSDFHVVVAGDSHAANWIPALAVLAEQRGWRLTTHTKSSCALLRAPVSRRGKRYPECQAWGARVLESVRQTRPDLVVWAKSSGSNLWTADGDEPSSMEGAIIDVWRHLEHLGVRVIAIADTPIFPFDPPSCLSKKTTCSVRRAVAFRDDPILPAGKRNPSTPVIDMTDALCTATECPAVVGNVLAWRDRHHLTATYARMLAPFLGNRIDAAARDKGWPLESVAWRNTESQSR